MNQRVKILQVSSELLVQCLGPYPEGRTVRCVSDAIPLDARVVSVALSHPDRVVELLLESEAFEEVKDGDTIPQLEPIYTQEPR